MSCYITIAGGLGNQMLSYSLWYYLSKKKNVFLSPIPEGLLDHNGLEINRIFKNTVEITSEKKHVAFCRKLYSFLNMYVNGLLKFLGLSYRVDFFHNHLLSLIVFPRYNSYTFLSEIRDELIEVFRFPLDLDERNKAIRDEIINSQSISIHVRRGDYQSKIIWRLLLGDVCEKDYYKEAIKCIQKKFSNPKYYVFSDDVEWFKNNIQLDNVTYVTWNTAENSYIDMQLMSYCKANIIANSTFSLMASWLNINDNCLRIAPLKWTNQHPDTGIKYVPVDWTIIDNSQPFVSIVLDENISNPFVIIQSLLKQTFSDFEIVLPKKMNYIADSFKNLKFSCKASGHHVITISSDQKWVNCDRHYLEKILTDYLAGIKL